MEKTNAQKLSMVLTAQIVGELRGLPRGTISEETLALFEVAYKMSTALEDVLKAAYRGLPVVL